MEASFCIEVSRKDSCIYSSITSSIISATTSIKFYNLKVKSVSVYHMYICFEWLSQGLNVLEWLKVKTIDNYIPFNLSKVNVASLTRLSCLLIYYIVIIIYFDTYTHTFICPPFHFYEKYLCKQYFYLRVKNMIVYISFPYILLEAELSIVIVVVPIISITFESLDKIDPYGTMEDKI